MPPVETVALLALLYRSAYRDRASGSESLVEEMEGNPDGVSLLAMLASELDPADCDLIRLLDARSAAEVGRDLAAWDASRCEAVLHAWPHDPRDELAGEPWAEPYLARWPLVEATMAGLGAMSATREERREVFAQSSGQTVADVLEDEYAVEKKWDASDDDTSVCPSCKQAIPNDRLRLHLKGLDGARPECPRQDLYEIVRRSRYGSSGRPRYGSWESFYAAARPDS